ncbi:hypothetical protein [Candidatus Poriferisodalis sp.]|uniref:hypothetical protein n=1 Tax=Candidatus Poriferisodalis sp. TaxID=3101277 RepID=UPI003B02B815
MIRNIWRLYGGWWNLDPAYFKPSPKGELVAERPTQRASNTSRTATTIMLTAI